MQARTYPLCASWRGSFASDCDDCGLRAPPPLAPPAPPGLPSPPAQPPALPAPPWAPGSAAASSFEELVAALRDASVDRIVLAPGTYYLSSSIVIDRALVLEAAVPGTAVLDGQNSHRVLTIDGALGATVRGLNISRGYATVLFANIQRAIPPAVEARGCARRSARRPVCGVRREGVGRWAAGSRAAGHWAAR